MATYITIGNLTKDAEQKTTSDGREYVILRIADNDYKRNQDGKIEKDQNGHYITTQDRYLTVFVNEKAGALSASKLKKGHPIKIIGKPSFEVEKNAEGYDQYVLKSISAYKLDLEPFKNKSQDEVIEAEESIAA
jgi:single-stranded DNA-binding protein